MTKYPSCITLVHIYSVYEAITSSFCLNDQQWTFVTKKKSKNFLIPILKNRGSALFLVNWDQKNANWTISHRSGEFLTVRNNVQANVDRVDVYSNRHYSNDLFHLPNFNAQFLYSLTICMLHYNPRHVLSINMSIFRKTNYIITTSGIVTLCKRLYSMSDESRLQSRLLSSGILYRTVQSVTIPDAVIIQFVLLKMSMLMLETCRGL
jgi:hypothetical protein